MGQAETTVRQIREAHDLLDELGKLARVADSGFVATAGDLKVPLNPQKVEEFKRRSERARTGCGL